MEVEEQGEQWEEVEGDLEFRHTMIILRKGDDYFQSRYNRRMMPTAQVNPDVLEMHAIPTAHLWPHYSNDLTPAPDPLPVDSYIKRPRMIQYAEEHPSRIPDLFLAEARICEILRKHPHPNTARYLGCLVRDNRVTGLCLVKYDMTLEDRLQDQDRPLRRDILKGVESGIRHLHGLGIMHNDVNPSNIMFKADNDTPVIIDFDSCGREGEKLVKAGTMNWSDDTFDVATPKNDFYGLKKIEEAMSRW
jgi:serine/threonine protein kinase